MPLLSTTICVVLSIDGSGHCTSQGLGGPAVSLSLCAVPLPAAGDNAARTPVQVSGEVRAGLCRRGLRAARAAAVSGGPRGRRWRSRVADHQ
jgi:hypothetical protein